MTSGVVHLGEKQYAANIHCLDPPYNHKTEHYGYKMAAVTANPDDNRDLVWV